MVWSSANRNPMVAMVSAQNQSAMWISSTSISNEPIWTAMAGLVAMTLWLSSRAPVSPNRSLLRYAHANQRETGLLGRAEFYNALRLDTVAQSERELTLEMLKATLYGPAAAKIPAPKFLQQLLPLSSILLQQHLPPRVVL